MNLVYCTRCLYPNTKPRLEFDEFGVCSACRAFEARQRIDWEAREQEFELLCMRAKRSGGSYDCIVPVSGGKDSHYQVLKALEYGLRPLAVTAMTDHLTDIGWRNLNNISKLGVDHVMVQVDQKLRRRLNKYGLETVGDISYPEHLLIFTVPVREALLRGIDWIIWGECPEHEYGGPLEAQRATEMSRRWLEEFGGLNGLRVSDLADEGLASRRALYQYTYPAVRAPRMTFLGYYFPWDGKANAELAQKHGFEWHEERVSGTFISWENLDSAMTGIHDRFKFLKFGFGRCTDHVNNYIRRGWITREEGIELVRDYDGEFPCDYIFVTIHEVLAEIGMTLDDYVECERRFANPELFELRSGELIPKFEVK
jgi:N-acetyl sugar amidotransferase